MDLADLRERENSLFTKLQQFETELAEAREQIDQLKSTKTKTKQELRNLVGEKEQHLVLLQKCSELSQKCDAINFAEVEKSHDEVSYQIQIFANQNNRSFDLNVIFVFLIFCSCKNWTPKSNPLEAKKRIQCQKVLWSLSKQYWSRC